LNNNKRGRPIKSGLVKIGTKLTEETNENLSRASFNWKLNKWEIVEEALKGLFKNYSTKEARK